MLLKKILIILLLSLSLTTLNAQTYDVKAYEISSEQDIQSIEKEEELKTGMAIDIKDEEASRFNYRVAYEGDYMFMNNYLEEEKQIKNNNYYIGIGYKF